MTFATAIVRSSLLAAALGLCAGVAAQGRDTGDVAAGKHAFVDAMVQEHGFDRAALTAVIDGAKINQGILDAMSRPAERVVPWYEYRKIFLTEARIDAGVRFWTEHAASIDAMAERYGVAPEMLVAIVGIETFFGTRMGNYRVLDALATLAFAYPPRAKFFASELESFLLLAREEQVDVKAVLGSYAGAMGAGQFIPSSYRAYAVDGNGDGKRDLWSSWEDVLGSVANYFSKHNWKAGEPVVEPALRAADWEGPEPPNDLELRDTVGSLATMGYVFTTDLPTDAPAAAYSFEAEGGGVEYWVGYHNFFVVTRYNRSTKYALAAHQLSEAIRNRYKGALAANRSPAE